MENKLIKTDNYILVVDDSEIKDGDWMHRNDEQPTFVTPNFWWDFKDRYRKIIAHLPLNNSSVLEGVPLLEKKKTAVEWLIDELEEHYVFMDLKNTVVYQQARQMEKNQIIDAVNFGDERGKINTYSTAELYYHEKYGE